MFLGALCPGFKTLVGLPLGGLKKKGKRRKNEKSQKKNDWVTRKKTNGQLRFKKKEKNDI